LRVCDVCISLLFDDTVLVEECVKVLGTNENAVIADRIMKFVDENELNYI